MTAEPGTVRSHRRVTPAGRLATAVLAAGLVLAALVVGGAITSQVPDTDRREQSFIRSGGVGSPVDARTFDATVLGVRGGTKINGGGQAHDTSGIWVLARIRLVARAEPTRVGYAVLVDDRARVYRATGRITQLLATGGRILEPGIPVVGEIAFEVPLDAVTRLRLRLAGSQLDQRMDAMTECPLPVDSATLPRWKAQTTPLTLAAPEIAP
ncbi:MAG: hypothetical protein V7603_5709 [Micromonosporaceae bacterium]